MILPPATLGILGAGQLGRMLAMAARQLGYGVAAYAPPGDNPAEDVARLHVGAWDDHDALTAFALACDVVTYEFENVPVATVEHVANLRPVRPDARLLGWTQDRLAEHALLDQLGLGHARGAPVHDEADLAAAVAAHGLPGRIKSARGGYDGGGQVRLRAPADVAGVRIDRPYRFERDVAFDAEVSVILTRGAHDTAVFPVLENVHRDGILDLTRAPARVPPIVERRALAAARQIAEHVGLRGTLTVECFVVGEDVLVNELAPRVHNSGHLTIEATSVSQFEQHVRAVCGLPLLAPTLRAPAAMANLLGDGPARPARPRGLAEALAVPEAHLHLYGKVEARARRKLGHVTALGASLDEAVERAQRAARAITWA